MTFSNGQAQKVTRGRRRVWLLAGLFPVLLVAAASGVIWHSRIVLAERSLPVMARSAGIELIAVSVDRLDFAGMELSELRFGTSGAQRIAGAIVTWSISELIDRRLHTIEISGASLQATVRPDGNLVIEGFPPGSADRSADGLVFPKDLPFERVDVEHSRIAVTLPDGEADIAVAGNLEVSVDTLIGEISARYSAETQRGQGTGTGSASFAWTENDAPRGEFSLEFDRLVTANATGTNIRLNGSTDGVPAHLEDLSFRAEVSAEAIAIPQLSARDIALTAELSGGALDVRGAGKIFDWVVEVSTRLHPFDLLLPAEFVLNANGDAAILSEHVALVSAEGDVAIMIDAEIENPSELFAARDVIIQNPLEMADHVAARLKIEADLQWFALSGMLDTGAVAANASGHWSGGVLDVDIDDPSRAAGITLAPTLEKKLAAWMLKTSPFDAALTGGMGSPPTVRISWTDGILYAQAVGGVDVALPDGTMELEADGSATATLSGGIERFDIAALDASFAAVPTKYGVATGDILVTDISGEGETVSGVVAGEISVSAVSAGLVFAHQLAANIDSEFRTTVDEVSVVLSPGGTVTARDVRLPGENALPGTTRFTFADGTHLLALNRRTGGIFADVRLEPGAAELRLVPRALNITHGAVAVSGAWPGRLTVDVKNVGASLDKERGIEVAGLRLRADGKSSDAVVAITVTDAKPALPGLTLPSFDATGKVIRRGPSVEGELEVIATGGQPSLRARGQHSLETGKGNGEILDARLRFAPGVLQPGDINPAMLETIENLFATISLQGPIAWDGNGTLAPNLTLKIADLAATTTKFELSDASATVLLTGAPALQSPPGQQFTGQVRVGRLDPVPLDVSFQLTPGPSGAGPRLVIEQLAAQLAEGRLTTNQFTLTPPSIDTEVTLRLEGADLARAFEVIGFAGIGGTGRIGGEIPLVVRGNQVAISGGRLANDGPGEVFYNITALPQALIDRDDTVSLALRALSNFAYDELQVEMDKALDGPGKLGLRLTGANPDVLESHPFIFNITLESDFDRLAALVLEGLTTSQGLLRALALSAGSSGDAAASR